MGTMTGDTIHVPVAAEPVDDCGCQLERTPSGLHMCSCPLHEAAPDLLYALRLNWEHTDDNGLVFYCNCPRYDRLSHDCRKDPDHLHSTSCQVGRAALAKATGK